MSSLDTVLDDDDIPKEEYDGKWAPERDTRHHLSLSDLDVYITVILP